MSQETVVIGFDQPRIPFKVWGVDLGFHPDPTANQNWAEIVRFGPRLSDIDPEDPEQVTHAGNELRELLGSFLVDGHEGWQSAQFGFVTLAQVMSEYVKAVTRGIPTPPS